MTGSNSFWFANPGVFYENVATRSVRFSQVDNAALLWTPSSAGNRKKYTIYF